MIGGLPGIDATIDKFYKLGVSVNRRGRVEWVESNKAGNTVLSPANYPITIAADNKQKGLASKILGK
jgi:hypothetical protein